MLRSSTLRLLCLLVVAGVVAGGLLAWRSKAASATTSATLTVTDSGPHPVGQAFDVTVALSDVTFDATSPSWFGYDMELDYPSGVVQANSVAPTLCPQARWNGQILPSAVVTGCSLTTGSTQSSGVLETVSFTCLTNGTITLHLPARGQGAAATGSALFDGNAADFPMTLNDATVICGTGANDPTVTPTPVPATPTPTSTPDFLGRATFQLSDAGTHTVGEAFTVDADLTGLQFGTSTSWAGFDVNVSYDNSVLHATGVAPGICTGANFSNQDLATVVGVGCVGVDNNSVGTIAAITFVCVEPGNTSLQFAPPTILFDNAAQPFALTLTAGSASCIDGPTGTPTNSPTPQPTATPTATAVNNGPTTIGFHTPAGPVALNMPFIVNTDLVAFDASQSVTGTWAGWNIKISYDSSIISVQYATGTGLGCPASIWGNPSLAPDIVTGCALQRNTGTGYLDNIVLACINDGTSPLHFVIGDADGSVLFDEFANTIPTTFVDSSITCDRHVDDDGDGCPSSAEGALGLDPMNPWDFYSVPVPALFAAPDPRLDFKDNMVAVGDAQAVFGYFKAGAHLGGPLYEQDLNGNGVKDGVEYDRSAAGPALTGAPDGAISATDAQLAFAQFKANEKC